MEKDRIFLTATRRINKDTKEHKTSHDNPSRSTRTQNYSSNHTNDWVSKKRHVPRDVEEPAFKKSCTSAPNYATCSKNIAAKRMENLRKSLALKVKQEINNQCKKLRTPIIKNPIFESVIKDSELLPTPKTCNELNRFDKFSSEKLKKKEFGINPYSKEKRDYKSNKNEKTNTLDDITTTSTETENNNESGSERMDWSPINEDAIIQNINSIRSDIINKTNKNMVMLQDNSSCSTPLASKKLHIVIDSNIFLLNLKFIMKLEEINVPCYDCIVIIIPWIVLEELDYIKNGHKNFNNVQCRAQAAVKYINNQLLHKNPKFQGQTIFDATSSVISTSNPDDSILSCCLQLIECKKSVVLLSNDVNLRNKALIHHIPAYSHTEIICKLTEPIDRTDQLSLYKIKKIMTELLTHIVLEEVQNAFGDLWQVIIYIKPPLSLKDCLSNILKHWNTVFSIKLQKQCRPCIENFQDFLKKQNGDNYELFPTFHSFIDILSDSLVPQKQYNEFMEYCLRICIFLKNGYKEYLNRVDDTITALKINAE